MPITMLVYCCFGVESYAMVRPLKPVFVESGELVCRHYNLCELGSFASVYDVVKGKDGLVSVKQSKINAPVFKDQAFNLIELIYVYIAGQPCGVFVSPFSFFWEGAKKSLCLMRNPVAGS